MDGCVARDRQHLTRQGKTSLIVFVKLQSFFFVCFLFFLFVMDFFVSLSRCFGVLFVFASLLYSVRRSHFLSVFFLVCAHNS